MGRVKHAYHPFFVEDAFKQQQITKMVVEAALLQFIASFLCLAYMYGRILSRSFYC